MAKVFFSHGDTDRAAIDGVIAALRARQVLSPSEQVTDLSGVAAAGTNLRGVIKEAIGAAARVVVLWDGKAAASANVAYEIGMADALGKPIQFVAMNNRVPPIPGELDGHEVVALSQVL